MRYSLILLLFFVTFVTFANDPACPFGVTNDPVPGQCGLYIDRDADGYCDLGGTGSAGQHTEKHQPGQVDSCDVGLASGELSSEQMKAMTVAELAQAFGLSLDETIRRLEDRTTFPVTGGMPMQVVHDRAGLPMKIVRSLLNEKGLVKNEKWGSGNMSVAAVTDRHLTDDQFPIQAPSRRSSFSTDLGVMHFQFLAGWILLTIIGFGLARTWSSGFFFCRRVDANLTLLRIPILATIRYVMADNPLLLGKERGYTAMWLLYILLLVRPLHTLCLRSPKHKKTRLTQRLGRCVASRKQLGIIMFWLVGVHSSLYLIAWYQLDMFGSQLLARSTIAGLVGLVATLVCFFTSNKVAMCRLHRWRKPVQRLAYLALFGGVVHVLLLDLTRGLVLTILFLVWGIVRFLAERKK